MPRTTSESGPASGPLWWDGYAGRSPESPAAATISAPEAADVVIVGGGFTGLWTAYYLLREAPELSVLVLEAEHVGFGASGRNGGWVSGLFPLGPSALAARHGASATRALLTALQASVDEVGAVIGALGMSEASYAKGGMLYLARNGAQVTRAREAVAAGAAWNEGTIWLPAEAARERLAASNVLGGTWNPHGARIQPRALTVGLAAAVRSLGGVILENSPVVTARPGRVDLADGRVVAAGHVIRATEAYTAHLPGLRRRVAPVYSLVVATEPLPESTWATIGLAQAEVFSDYRHVIIYGQRTADGRLVLGGRGAPYHFGSAIAPTFDRDDRVFDLLRRTARELLPQLAGTEFTHAWGGPLGIPRDWHPAIGYDRAARVGWAGGYVGDGVAASNLAGRTLADLVRGRPTHLTALPWVNHRSPAWEPEPLRWFGINAGLRLAALADTEERRTGRPARVAPLLSALTGH